MTFVLAQKQYLRLRKNTHSDYDGPGELGGKKCNDRQITHMTVITVFKITSALSVSLERHPLRMKHGTPVGREQGSPPQLRTASESCWGRRGDRARPCFSVTWHQSTNYHSTRRVVNTQSSSFPLPGPELVLPIPRLPPRKDSNLSGSGRVTQGGQGSRAMTPAGEDTGRRG